MGHIFLLIVSIKEMERNKPESDGTLIKGSAENSDLCTPIPHVKNKPRNILFTHQNAGDPCL